MRKGWDGIRTEQKGRKRKTEKREAIKDGGIDVKEKCCESEWKD